MNELEKAWNIGTGTHEELRGGGMAGSVQGESTQRWLGISEGVVGKNNP